MAVSHMKLHLQLGPDFLDELKNVMDDELAVASAKWNYYPNEEETVALMKHGLNQVRLRINSVSNSTWDFTDTITFSMPGPKDEYVVPSDEATATNYRLLRSRDGWLVDPDQSEDSVPLAEFRGVFLAEVKNWARTAVFYSVGSYKV